MQPGQQPQQTQQHGEATPSGQPVTDTNNGFLVGTDPQQPPRTVADWGQPDSAVSTSQQQSQQPLTVEDTQQPSQPLTPNSNLFTQEDIERARKEEKDKLYGRLSTMEEELKAFRQEREEAAAREAEAREREEAERKAAEEAEMDAKSLILRKEQEWQERLNELQRENERAFALVEKERQLQELESYRRDRIEQEAEQIMPELRDLVVGDSIEQIEKSIETMKGRTAQIMQNITAGIDQQRQQMRGTAPTAPPVGPLENAPMQRTLTDADIRSMSMDEYRRHREQLLNAARPQR